MLGQLPDVPAAGVVVSAAGVELLDESLVEPEESEAAVLLESLDVELLESVWAAASAAPPPTIAPVSASASKLCRSHFMCLTSSRLWNWQHRNVLA
jgi:hypothetical protein